MSRRADARQDMLALGLLAVLTAAPYWRIAAPDPWRAWFVDGDFVDQFFAFARYETARFAAGELPLWNPFAYAGSPFWADIQAAVAYPPSLIVVLASALTLGHLPFIALELEAVAHVVLASWFTYFFARRVLGCRSGALVSALAFGLGGWVNGYAPLQLAVIESAVWLPLALWGVDRWLADVQAATESGPVTPAPVPSATAGVPASPGSVTAATTRSTKGGVSSSPGPLALGLALGFSVLAGHPQTVLYTMYATAAWAGWRVWQVSSRGEEPWIWTRPRTWAGSWSADRSSRPPRPTRPAPSTLLRSRGLPLRTLVGFTVAGVLSALISAAGWLPAAEFLRASNRASASFDMLAHGFPPREFVGLVIPGLTQWSPLYIGLLPLLLAVAAARRSIFGGVTVGDREARGNRPGQHDPFWIGLATVALLFSLGGAGPLFDFAYHFMPGFDLFRGQERAAYLISFSLAMLAGSGVAAWRRGADQIGHTVLISAAAAIVLGALLAVVASPGARPSVWHLLEAGAATALFAGLGLGVFSMRRFQLPAAGQKWLIAAIVIIAADLFAVTSGTNLADRPPQSLDAPPVIELAASPGVQRVLDEDRYPRNSGVQYSFESLTGSSPLRLATFETLRDGLNELAPDRLRSLLAVSHVITWRESLDGAIVVEIDARWEPITLYELSPVAPYAWRTIAAEVSTDEQAAISRLRDPAFEPLNTVILHDDGGDVVGGGPHGGTGITDVRERAPGLIRVRSESDLPGWIVFSEMYAPGWGASIDGEPAVLHRADVALMAVPVPPGDHEIALRYRPRSIAVGLGLSMLGVFLAIAWTIFLLRRVPGPVRV